jgi:hypothetical protein
MSLAWDCTSWDSIVFVGKLQGVYIVKINQNIKGKDKGKDIKVSTMGDF